jgi:hypothetical protein
MSGAPQSACPAAFAKDLHDDFLGGLLDGHNSNGHAVGMGMGSQKSINMAKIDNGPRSRMTSYLEVEDLIRQSEVLSRLCFTDLIRDDNYLLNTFIRGASS